jgi:hypothetical protein
MSRSRWTYHDRGRWAFWPIFVNYVRDTPWSLPRVTSYGFKIGRWTRNITRKTDTFDTPGRGVIRRRYK